MKKILVSFLAVLVLAAMLAIPAMAADGSVTVSSATGASGETVTLTVSLSGFEQATGLAVTVTGLPVQSGSFLISGGFGEFDISQNQGAWMSIGEAVSVNTAVAQLSFKVPEFTGQKAYPITVSVNVHNDSGLLGSVTQNGTVTVNNPAESVSLDKSTLALDLSGTKTGTLTATAAPATTTDTVVWSSSDATVASVANGTVTALKPGTATITATAGTKSATCAVTVSCSHTNAVKTDAEPATCQKTGNNAYYTCADCNQVLKSDKATVTTVAAETLATIAHSGGTATCTEKAVCTMCDQPYGEKKAHSFATAWSSDANQHWHICATCNTEKGSVAAHSFTWKVDKAATEDATGLKHEECACGYKRNENTVIPKLDHKHTGITKHNAVKATCVKTGTVEYWTCSSPKCTGKYYGDAQCQTELSTITQAINANNHAGKTELRDKVEATCAKEGYSGDTWCLDCKTMSKKGAVVPATGKHTAKAAYLTDENNHWQECSVCNAVIGEKAAHSFKWVTDKYATETATGLKHEACSVCKLERSKDTVIDKLPHVPTKVEGKAATCTEEGALEHFHCVNCGGYYASEDGKQGAAIKKEDITVAALGHSFAEAWTADEKGHWHVCATCGEASEAEAHTTEVVGAVEATETAEGYTGDTVCTVCETVVEQGQTIPIGGEEPTVSDTLPTGGEPVQQTKQPKQKTDTGLVIAICLLVLIAIGGGAYLLVKKPWKK